MLYFLTWAFSISVTKVSGHAPVLFLVGSLFSFEWISRIKESSGRKWRCFHVCDICCSFSCHHFRLLPILCRLWVLRLRWDCSLCLLSSAEDKKEQSGTISVAVGGIYVSQPLTIRFHWKSAVLDGTRVLVPPEKVGSYHLKSELRSDARFFL